MKFVETLLPFAAFTQIVAAKPHVTKDHGIHTRDYLLKSANDLTKVNKKNTTRSVHELVASWDLDNLTIAAVRTPPASWPMPLLNKNWTGIELDLSGTVELAVSLIEKAAANDVRIIHFPEVWFPGYPKGVIDNTSPNVWFEYQVKDYINNSLTVGSDNWNKLAQAAVDNEIYLGFGYSEKFNNHLYIAQALIAPDGEVLIRRHKLRPSMEERDLWTDGQLDQIYAVTTPIGRIGMLNCWEHITPEAMFTMQAQKEDIHLGSWPLAPEYGNRALGYESSEVITAFALFYASISNAIVVQASVGLAAIFPAGQTANVTNILADVDFDTHPMVYSSFNANKFDNVTYDPNAQASWATLQGMNRAFPSYIPREMGNFTAYQEQDLQELMDRSVVKRGL